MSHARIARRGAALAILLLSTAATACSRAAHDATGPSPAQTQQQRSPVAATLGTPFDLRIGQSADVEGTGLRATVTRVADDSRCPIDVVCVWEGDAEVSVRLERASRAAVAQLHTSPRAGGLREVEYDGYVVHLDALAPAPHSGRPIPAGDYVATLTVRAK
jgi:hypothetical protein